MDPQTKVIECIVQVAGPADHVGDYIAGATISSVCITLILGLVSWAWIEKRNKSRDRELDYLKTENQRYKRRLDAMGTTGEI